MIFYKLLYKKHFRYIDHMLIYEKYNNYDFYLFQQYIFSESLVKPGSYDFTSCIESA